MDLNVIVTVMSSVSLLVGILVFILIKGGILMNLWQKMWCKLFGCPTFVAHASDVSVIKADMEIVRPDVSTMKADVANLKTNLAAMVPILVGIAAQFPVTAELGTIPAEIDALGIPDMSVWFESVEAARVGDVVDVDIWAKFTVGAEVKAVGIGNPGASLVGISFDPAHFQFLEGQETRGLAVVDWGLFDVHENNPGQLTFGAAAGAARGIIGDKPVHLATIRLQVTTTDFVSTTIEMDNYVDSLIDCRPAPSITEVLLNEN